MERTLQGAPPLGEINTRRGRAQICAASTGTVWPFVYLNYPIRMSRHSHEHPLRATCPAGGACSDRFVNIHEQ